MARKAILVEGLDDCHCVGHLCKYHGIELHYERSGLAASPETPSIDHADNVEALLAGLPLRIRLMGSADRLAVILDADIDVKGRWSALAGQLVAAGFKEPPKGPDGSALILEQSDLPRLGVWLMPDNSTSGVLEDYLPFLMEPDDPLWPIAGECIEHARAVDARFSTRALSKARLHTWLAWQKEPGAQPGAAINQRYLDPSKPMGSALVDWLRKTLDI